MIPQNQGVVLRRIILVAEIQKLCQGLRLAHVGISLCPGDDPFAALFGHVQNGVAVTGNVRDPSHASARVNHYIVVVIRQVRLVDLRNILGGVAIAALQVGADHVDHYGVELLLRLLNLRVPAVFCLIGFRLCCSAAVRAERVKVIDIHPA